MGSVRHKEDKHDPCSRMTREVVKCSMFLIKFCLIKKKRDSVIGLNYYPVLGTELCPPTPYPGAFQVAQW